MGDLPMGRRVAIVNEAVGQYVRLLPHYRRIAEVVGETLQRELARRGILSTVHWRAKDPASLRRKLHRRDHRTSLDTPHSARRSVSDLAAARICTYGNADRERALAVVCELFMVDAASVTVKDDERTSRSDTSRWYRATHLHLRLRPDQLDEATSVPGDDICELQICSLLEYAYNEIEHDVAYKPAGKPPAAVVELLNRLGAWREAGDRMVDQLLRAHHEFRSFLGEKSIRDLHEFAAGVTERLGIDVGDGELRQLHEALLAIGIEHAADVWRDVWLDDFYTVDTLMGQLSDTLRRGHATLGTLDLDDLVPDVDATGDRLLALLLPRLAPRLAVCAPPRIATISKAFLRLTRGDAHPL